MRPMTPNTNKGRTVARDDIHRKTADQSRNQTQAAAKVQKHAARQEGKREAQEGVE